jgi:hypothetical protein
MEVIKKVLLSLIVIAVGFIPVELYFLVKLAFGPEGFWQNFVLIVVALCFGGGVQLVLLIALLIILLCIWTE